MNVLHSHAGTDVLAISKSNRKCKHGTQYKAISCKMLLMHLMLLPAVMAFVPAGVS